MIPQQPDERFLYPTSTFTCQLLQLPQVTAGLTCFLQLTVPTATPALSPARDLGSTAPLLHSPNRLDQQLSACFNLTDGSH